MVSQAELRRWLGCGEPTWGPPCSGKAISFLLILQRLFDSAPWRTPGFLPQLMKPLISAGKKSRYELFVLSASAPLPLPLHPSEENG